MIMIGISKYKLLYFHIINKYWIHKWNRYLKKANKKFENNPKTEDNIIKNLINILSNNDEKNIIC